MRGGPYKPRLPRDRKLWPVVFSPPFHSLFTHSSACLLLLYHHCSPHVYFSLLWHLPRVSRPMRERTADGIVLPHPLSVSRPPTFVRNGGFLLFFDRIWISRYKLSPCPVGALPSLSVHAHSRSFGENEFHFLQ